MGYPPINPAYITQLMDGTEMTVMTLASDTVKHYNIKVYYETLLNGAAEALEIRVYDTKTENFDTSPVEVLAEFDTVTGVVQPSPPTVKKVIRYYISSRKIRISCKQTLGTFRNISVEVHQI